MVYLSPPPGVVVGPQGTGAVVVIDVGALRYKIQHASQGLAAWRFGQSGVINRLVDDFIRRERPLNEDDDDSKEEEGLPSDLRRDACIVIDDPSLTSLTQAPDLVSGGSPDLDPEPWVVVVNAKDPASVPYGGGGPYIGFMRLYARVFSQLFEDLGLRCLVSLSPVRKYDSQMPLYDGSSQGKLVDLLVGRKNISSSRGVRHEGQRVHRR
ncbi:hypothetical protein LX32DRAFT_695059 [Colletotrichum zoysiae]|uniref:Uncharacterized protein n=1 Tax=Colletotrichum zoysiae TaxID=1216348 RepID=A0AAD9HFX6_9PEZI|nr:hypothetical protein LX32DRAFT_695059 [Colletotrichum zoysiae]